MSLKNILVVLDHAPGNAKRLASAISLAQAHDAHLTTLHLGIEFVMPAPVVASMPSIVFDEQRAELRKRAEAVSQAAQEQAQKAGQAIECRTEIVISELAGEMVARHARHADLTIVGQPDRESDEHDLQRRMIEAAFLQSGRPALAIPHSSAANFPSQLAVVAWDGSQQAARAMNDALPLLAQAKEVRLITVDAETLGDRLGELPGADATLHLARHGIRAELRKLSSGNLSVSDAILNEVGDSGADLLVMGGYGHSRMREMILGGATRGILDVMTCATLLAH